MEEEKSDEVLRKDYRGSEPRRDDDEEDDEKE